MRRHHSALHEEKGDAARLREVIMGVDGMPGEPRRKELIGSTKSIERISGYTKKLSKYDHDVTRT